MSALEIIQTEVKTMQSQAKLVLVSALDGISSRSFSHNVNRLRKKLSEQKNRSLSPIECFDYKYPITVVIEDDTVEVVRFDQYADLHRALRCIVSQILQGAPTLKAGTASNRTPTGKGHTHSNRRRLRRLSTRQ